MKSNTARVLTLYEPWAALMRKGVKLIETRGHKTNYRGPLIIHAGKKVVEDEFDEWNGGIIRRSDLHPGHAVAVCTMTDCVNILDLRNDKKYPFDPNQNHGHQLMEQAAGNYASYRYAWVMKDLLVIPTPIPHRGSQGMPRAPVELMEAIHDQIGSDWFQLPTW